MAGWLNLKAYINEKRRRSWRNRNMAAAAVQIMWRKYIEKPMA